MQSLPSILIPALWAAWVVYWLVESLKVRAARRMESLSSCLSHTVPLWIGVVLMVSPRWMPAWLFERVMPRDALAAWIGIALLVAGIAFSVWARRHLAGFWSSVVTLKQNHRLIRSGPYRYVRHPIYTGILLSLLGTAIAIGEWHGFISVAVIAAGFSRKIAVEERFLREAFPAEYDLYRADVPALIPFLR